MFRKIIPPALALFTLFSAPQSASAGDEIRRLCVTGVNNYLNVREYGYSSARVVHRLNPGQCVTVVGVCEVGTNDWCNVHFGNRKDGMVNARFLAPKTANPFPKPRQCGWYAIASCSTKFSAAKRTANHVNAEVINTSSRNFPNFRAGYFCSAIGPLSRGQALGIAGDLKSEGYGSAYAKSSC